MSVSRVFAGVIAGAVLIAVISFFAAPMVAFSAIRSAAEAEDVQGLTRLVDFDAVRASLRPQLAPRPVVEAPPPSFLDDPVEAIRRRLRDQPAFRRPTGPQPDDYLSAPALHRLTVGLGRSAVGGRAALPKRTPRARLTRWGVDRTRMAVIDLDGRRTAFTFERRGPFRWMLVHVGLPARPSAAGEPNGQAGVVRPTATAETKR